MGSIWHLHVIISFWLAISISLLVFIIHYIDLLIINQLCEQKDCVCVSVFLQFQAKALGLGAEHHWLPDTDYPLLSHLQYMATASGWQCCHMHQP